LSGVVSGQTIQITSRKKLASQRHELVQHLPPAGEGLECIVLIDDRYAAAFRFRDEPRDEGRSFVRHLMPRHGFGRLMIVSGDRASEVRYLADRVGIANVFAEQSPEQKLRIVQDENRKAQTLYLGDGINDAPALMAATVGVALGQNSDITSQAAGAVILDSSLTKVDEFFHISRRMRRIALQSAVGGMALSIAGMVLASLGLLPPVAGAVSQELIDLAVVANALRAAWPPAALTDMRAMARESPGRARLPPSRDSPRAEASARREPRPPT
jgi:P-type E1-E2 ATPase